MRAFALALLVALVGCGSTKPDSQAKADTLEAECEAAIKRGKAAGATKWFDSAYGYLVFPEVARPASSSAAPTARGRSTSRGRWSASRRSPTGTVGLQIGAQSFSEIIFFKDKVAFPAFKEGNYELGPGATVGANIFEQVRAGSAEGARAACATI